VDGEASAKSFYGYPTVNSGPMDISKAKEVLGFSPTPTEEAVRQTVHFYEEAFYAFPNQRDEVLSELFTSAIPKVLLRTTLIKKNIKFSSYIRKFKCERLHSHIWGRAS
jgi:hypothetical protein